MPNVTLQTSDNVNFEIDVTIVKCSRLIKTLLEDCKMENGKTGIIILPNVESEIFRLVLEYIEHHLNEPEQQEGEQSQRADGISPWDDNFLNVDHRTLCAIVSAANYLDIENLFLVGCKTVSKFIRGKTVQEMRDFIFFNTGA